MLIEFLYKGEKYCCESLPKKLRRMKITEADIEILPPKDKRIEYENKKYIYFYNPNNKHTIQVGYDYENNEMSDKYECLKGMIWNNETKTGVRDFNMDDWVLLNGKPEYPIKLDNNTNLPVMQEIYWQSKTKLYDE